MVSYRRDGSIQAAYEEHIPHREVIYKRVVEKRPVLRPEQDYVHEYDYEDLRYSDSRNYRDHDGREHRVNMHAGVDRAWYHGETTRFSSGSRRSPPPRKDSYHYYRGSRDNTPTGHQLRLSGERAGSLPSSRGRGPAPPRSLSAGKVDRGEKPMHELTYTGENHEDFRRRVSYPEWERSRSPLRRDAQDCSYQQSQQRRYKKAYSQNREPDRAPNPSGSLDALRVKEDPPALVSKPESGVRVGVKSENAPEEDFATRRSREIANKALEIEKLYRQDCITFGTVVNMLVTKEPRLDQLLQAPLHKSLIEIKERCLEDLRHFIKDLDQVPSKLATLSK